MTLGTVRLEKCFHKMRESILSTGPELPAMLKGIVPMFEPKVFASSKKNEGWEIQLPRGQTDREIRFHHPGDKKIFRLSRCPLQGVRLCLGAGGSGSFTMLMCLPVGLCRYKMYNYNMKSTKRGSSLFIENEPRFPHCMPHLPEKNSYLKFSIRVESI